MIEVVAALFGLLAAWCLWSSLLAIIRGAASRSWPSASGVIRTAQVVKKNNREGDEVWRYVLEYSYSIDGAKYRGRRMRYGIPNALIWSNPNDPSFRALTKNDPIEVFHHPSQPGVSVLQRGTHPFVIVTIIAGATLAWMAWALFTLPG
jgi:hypothetical protein